MSGATTTIPGRNRDRDGVWRRRLRRDGRVRGRRGGTDDDEGKPCVDAFRITEESVRFPNGSVPEVRLRLGNTGDGPIEYDLDVIFEQATSTGIYAKSGRDTLSGTIVAGGSVVVTATADGLDARSTDRYDVEVSLACPSR